MLKCRNQSLDLNSQATRKGKESNVVGYTYRTDTWKSEWGGSQVLPPTHPSWCFLLTPAPEVTAPLLVSCLAINAFQAVSNGRKAWTSRSSSQLCKVDTLHTCLYITRFKLPITLGMYSLIAVFLKERLREVELLAKVTQVLHGRTGFQLVCLMSKAFVLSTGPAFSSSKQQWNGW